jgi:hypothetical protein
VRGAAEALPWVARTELGVRADKSFALADGQLIRARRRRVIGASTHAQTAREITPSPRLRMQWIAAGKCCPIRVTNAS